MSADSNGELAGKTVLLTGGNTGIGKFTAIGLAKKGAKVVITSRNPSKGRAALAEIQAAAGPNADVTCVELDLASFASIEACAEDFKADHERLDVLILNAGLILDSRHTTEQGFETTFGVNHLGHFLLTKRLRPLLERSAPSRVVVVASDAHKAARKGLDFDDLMAEGGYSTIQAYGRSKLANIMFTRELSRRLEGTGVTANCLHPGVVRTEFGGGGDVRGPLVKLMFAVSRPFFLSAEKGARTSIYLASEPSLKTRTGGYYVRCKPANPTSVATDRASAERLWSVSEALIDKAGS